MRRTDKQLLDTYGEVRQTHDMQAWYVSEAGGFANRLYYSNNPTIMLDHIKSRMWLEITFMKGEI